MPSINAIKLVELGNQLLERRSHSEIIAARIKREVNGEANRALRTSIQRRVQSNCNSCYTYDLNPRRAFYVGRLGRKEVWSSPPWVDFGFYGRQVVAHLAP